MTLDEAMDDLVFSALEQRASDFTDQFAEIIKQRAFERIEDIKVDIAQSTFAEPEEVQEEVEDLGELHGKGSINKISDYHAKEGDKHDADSNAGDYHTAQQDRASSVYDRIQKAKALKQSKERNMDMRGYAKDRKRVMDKEGPGAQAREIH